MRSQCAGGSLRMSLEDGAWCRHHGVQGEQIVERNRIDPTADPAGGDQCLRGRGKAQPAVGLAPIQRLDPEAIAGEEELVPVGVPDRKREHPVQSLDAAFSPGMPGLEDHLGVAVGEETVAAIAQLAAQLWMIIDRAVEYQREPEP